MPPSVTQLGISAKIGVRQSDISLAAKKLRERGQIQESSAKIHGARKRQKVFSLTEAGKAEAERLAERAGAMTARVKTSKGIEEAPLTEISSRLGLALSEVISRLEGDYIDMPSENEKTEDRPEPKPNAGFYGREAELRELKGALESNRLVVVEGIAGIGKTTLVKRALEGVSRPIFEFRCREHTTSRVVERKLAEFLAGQGRTKTKRYLDRTSIEEPTELSEWLEADLVGGEVVIVLDDAHSASEILPFLRMLIEILERGRCFAAIVATRHALPFYDRRDVLVKGLVFELVLKGLDERSALKMLKDAGIADAQVYSNTKGHPLFLELICAHGVTHADSMSDFLNEEVSSKLSLAEKALVMNLSALEGDAKLDLISDDEESIDTLDGLVRKNIVARKGANYELHDCLRTFFYNRLTEEQKRAVHVKLAKRLERVDIFECLNHLVCAEAVGEAIALIKKEQSRLLETPEDFCPLLTRLISLVRVKEPSRLAQLEPMRERVVETFGKWDDLLEYLHQCKKLARLLGKGIDDDALRGSRSKKECEAAIENYKASMRLLVQMRDVKGLEELRLGLARTYWMLNMPLDALRESNGVSDSARKHAFVASVGFAVSEPINAELEARRALECSNDDRERARITCLLGYIAEESGDLSAARTHYAEALTKARAAGYVRGLAYGLLNEGTEESVKAARELFRKMGDDVGLVYCAASDGARLHSCDCLQQALSILSGKGLIAYERALRQLIANWSGSNGKNINDK